MTQRNRPNACIAYETRLLLCHGKLAYNKLQERRYGNAGHRTLTCQSETDGPRSKYQRQRLVDSKLADQRQDSTGFFEQKQLCCKLF